jgi:hypothetical protein
MSTITREQLEAFFTEGQDEPHTRNLLEDALGELNWNEKADFTPQDVLKVETVMLDVMRGGLAEMGDPFAQKMAAVMGAAQKLLQDPRFSE